MNNQLRMRLKCAAKLALFVCLFVSTELHDRSVPETKISMNDYKCMVSAIHNESAGESLSGKQAVANVIINRIQHSEFPKSICRVVYQRNQGVCQFTWVCQKNNPGKISAETHHIAFKALTKKLPDNTRGALFFRTTKNPAKNEVLITKIDNHYFYKTKGEYGEKTKK